MQLHAVRTSLLVVLLGSVTNPTQAQQRVDPAPDTPERQSLASLFRSNRQVLAGLPECKPRRRIVQIEAPQIPPLGRAPPHPTTIMFLVDIGADGKVRHAAPEFAVHDIAFMARPFYESLIVATFATGKEGCRQSNSIALNFTD